MNTETQTTCECFKCGGRGHIEAFNCIAGGVCFQCSGSGKLPVAVQKKAKADLSEYNRVRADWLLGSTYESFKGLSFARVSEARDFAHSYKMNVAARNVYGQTVHTAWMNNGGEQRFQELQVIRRESL